MWRLAALAEVVVAVSMLATTATGQDYTFGDWARDQGYSPGDSMPGTVNTIGSSPAIDSLDGIDEFFWTATPTTFLYLSDNLVDSIEPNTFDGLTRLTGLFVEGNQLSSIEAGAFNGLMRLTQLALRNNQISSIEADDFSGVTNLLSGLLLSGNQIASIEADAFNGLTHLTLLKLGENQISSIEAGTFSGLTNLTSLHLNDNQISSIEAGTFSGLTNVWELRLERNQISSIEAGTFSGLTSLTSLRLDGNQISSIEAGAFSGMTNLTKLWLHNNGAMTKLNLAEGTFANLTSFAVAGNHRITIVSLRNAVVNQTSLATLVEPIGQLDSITEMDLSGFDFGNITDLAPLYTMDNLIDLWLVDTMSLDASDLDVLLDNLAIIEGSSIEGFLHITEADYDAFNTAGGGLLAAWDAEPGHHVEFLQIGDMSHDDAVNGLDVDPFIDVLLAGKYDAAADMNGDGSVNGLDVDPFVSVVVGGAQQIPEPSTILLCLVALGVFGGWRKWGG